MINRTPPIRFSSTIRVVSWEDFSQFNEYQLQEQGMYADSPFTYRQRVRLKPEGLTKGAYICNTGGMQNGDKLTLFHLVPRRATGDGNDEKDWLETSDALDNDIRELKKENPEVRAVLSGGNPVNESSLTLQESLLALFAKWRIPTSILWGANGVAIHYDTQSDTWTLSAVDMEPTLDEFRERFPDVRIAPGDQLFIGDKEIEAGDVNTR